jgi:hypothetical protein
MGIILENEAEYFGMKDRIAELEAENAAWIREHQNLVHLYQNQLAENAELQKDAARYRWLRDDDNWGDDADHRWEMLGEKSCKDFDAAIDAAMGES